MKLVRHLFAFQRSLKSTIVQGATTVMISVIFVELSSAALTVTCLPLGEPEVATGQIFEIECFVSSDVSQDVRSSQLDFPCSLANPPLTMGDIDFVGALADPDGDGAAGPSSTGVPYLYGPTGLFAQNPTECVISGLLHFGTTVTISEGQTRYLGTIQYEVAECALGTTEVVLEGRSEPPVNSDTTLFREPDLDLIQATSVPLAITIATTTCCLPDEICADLGIQCCVAQGGIPGGMGTSCAISFDFDGEGWPDECDSCPDDVTNDSDNDGVCDSGELCPGEDDTIDANNDQVPDCLQKIPTTTAWGIVVLTLALATAGKTMYSFRHRGIATADS